MSVLLNGCLVQFEGHEKFVCDAYKVGSAFIFKFNRNMYEHPWPDDIAKQADALVDREGQVFVFDRTEDLHLLVVDESKVTVQTEKFGSRIHEYNVSSGSIPF